MSVNLRPTKHMTSAPVAAQAARSKEQNTSTFDTTSRKTKGKGKDNISMSPQLTVSRQFNKDVASHQCSWKCDHSLHERKFVFGVQTLQTALTLTFNGCFSHFRRHLFDQLSQRRAQRHSQISYERSELSQPKRNLASKMRIALLN